MRVVYYLNQFYAQIGGEELASIPLQVLDTPIGPSAAFAAAVRESGIEVVATLVCGDNYFSEHNEEVTEQITDLLKQYNPDLVVAGPAFNAGRYGIACGSVMKIAQQVLEIPALSAMYEENPGVMLYKLYGYILPAPANARGMRKVMADMVAFAAKIASGQRIGSPAEDGYIPRGARKNVWYEESGAVRAMKMLMAKLNGDPFTTELPMPKFDKVEPSKPIPDLTKATIAIMTSGGIVPTGNPDHLESLACTKWKTYDVEDFGGEDMPNVDVAHGGYDPTFAIGNGNRVLPVDAMMQLERDGVIGKLYNKIFVTVGNCMPVDRAATFGQQIADSIKGKVDGVILTST